MASEMELRSAASDETAPDPGTHPTPARLSYDLGGQTDPGNERGNNEDCFGLLPESASEAMLVVADGVGGYEGGEVASRMAVDVTLETYREAPKTLHAGKRIGRAAQRANIEIYGKAIVIPELRHMSSTLTAVAVESGVAYVAHVGDSRLYLLRGPRIRQLTKDHTVVAERLRRGTISRERARTHPDRSTLTRSLGRELIVGIDSITFPLEQGDTLVICTDGVYSVLDPEVIHELGSHGSADGAARALIDEANRHGSIDNVTALVFRAIDGPPCERHATGWRLKLRALLGR